MKWVAESSPTAVTRRSGKTQLCGSLAAVTRQRGARWRWGACQGASSSGPRSKRRLFIASGTLSRGGDSSLDGSSSSRRRLQSPSLACTTTPCPTAGWPPVTWKGSGAHVPLSVQAARAPARGYSPTELPTPLRAQLASGSPSFCLIFISFSSFISKARL
ncbi:unnamed protein product [Spirodela intermedia]|uniref:Uncharacterized protein n=1 Tax=Spirodela intermedia TaxID=51605 RepID=A0ABN7E9X0_SPIIN|nr:unnamed protein product [Spirodela intermedia]